ncbi:hypothetical protein [Streptomyces sp. DH37]|uniref:hypothetical protein n=1 Tax=Streptomyces sp. DH37 TaxID=3040122 RepID=UPI002441E304|nr:hypothetical protein [Streptomyces sp. DH37]MDG9703824.1 hypothetical protein [Streptomyces sp. DH37]
MPTTDDYGQGVNIAALTDAPNAETLAKNIVNAILRRSVLSYADAAERDATLTGALAPVDGQVAYLQAEQLLTARVAGAWVAIGSATSSWTTVNLVDGFAHDGNANGTVQYRRLNLFGEQSIQLKGALAVTYSPSIPNAGVFTAAPLPTNSRPTKLRTVTIPCSDVDSTRITLKLDAQPGGHLKIYGTNSSDTRPPWIGFNGVFYSL